MRRLDHLVAQDDLSGAWCNANAVTSSVMEAISFTTPVLENFFIHTVAECMPGKQDAELRQRCRSFMHEESTHTRAHKKFNASLLDYLLRAPPGAALLQAIMAGARKHVTLSRRLLYVVALEHFAAVLSKRYLTLHRDWKIGSAYARELFEQHAREEMGHRSVVFDLWVQQESIGRVARTLAVLSILFAGGVYISVAVPWIVHRKNDKRVGGTLAALAAYVLKSHQIAEGATLLRELFSFTRRDFHPDGPTAAQFAGDLK